MKSPMVTNASYIPEKKGYSELKVLRSGAGYYIGTMYVDPVDGFEEPGSRDSDYFASKEAAEDYLRTIEASGDGIAGSYCVTILKARRSRAIERPRGTGCPIGRTHECKYRPQPFQPGDRIWQ